MNLEYKGYHTVVEYDTEARIFHGKIEGINDHVDFQCDDSTKVEEEFRKAVDDYLAFCEEVGKMPEIERIVLPEEDASIKRLRAERKKEFMDLAGKIDIDEEAIIELRKRSLV